MASPTAEGCSHLAHIGDMPLFWPQAFAYRAHMIGQRTATLWLLYTAMLWPAWQLIADLFVPQWYYPQMMYDSGVWSVTFLIGAIAVTPILRVINAIGHGKAFGRWLLRVRRHLGIVSAIYAALHVAHYIRDAGTLGQVWGELTDLKIALGWAAFILMMALALTSNAASVRRLGKRWKTLHLWVYPAAALIFVHWYMFDFVTARVVFWAALFCAPKLVQIILSRSARQTVLR